MDTAEKAIVSLDNDLRTKDRVCQAIFKSTLKLVHICAPAISLEPGPCESGSLQTRRSHSE
ncbi:hypothetical protein J6590_032123 [Homalodisca vitripennis]|nr:hypothetical protein J6590_032123 [Homalodisca vitripennis]